MMVYRCLFLFSDFDLKNKGGRFLWLKMYVYCEDLQLGRSLLASFIVSRELILTAIGF